MTSHDPRTRGFSLGHVFGARVVVQPSTLLMVLILALLFSTAGGGELNRRSFSMGVLFALLLFVSVFLHELAHAATAKGFGRTVNEVVLTLWGGHTSFDARGLTPKVAGVTAIAGPLANLVVALLAALPIWLGWVELDLLDRVAGDIWLYAALQWLVWTNVLLAIFNALPGIPMDGGRVVESIVWASTGSRFRGMYIAAWCGRVIAIGLVIYAVAAPLVQGRTPGLFDIAWAALIFMVLWPAASQAIKVSQAMLARESISLRQLMVPAVALPHTASAAQAATVARDTGAGEIIVVSPDGHAAGHFPVTLLNAVPESDFEQTRLVSVTMPLPRGATISIDATGEALVQALNEWWGKADVLVVIDAGGFAGVLRLADAMKALQ
ncbi:site-2 protease family protein [Demequina sediminicola]|uniref:site-2 protease family protein n=1 Tax=Demequina sediminicola TaxID=1095026 RepID=UPI0013792BC5|nr:site-2 protease family protein [Demequina sediminicola]